MSVFHSSSARALLVALGLTWLGCDTPKAVPLTRVTMAPPAPYSQGAPPTTPGQVLRSSGETYGLCLVDVFPEHQRMIVVETTQACREARHQQGAFQMVDTSTMKQIAAFEGYTQGSDASGVAVVVLDGARVLMQLKTGAALKAVTSRQDKGQPTHLRWLLSKDSPHVWVFERWGSEQDLQVRFARLDGPLSASSFAKPLELPHKGLFWPDRLLIKHQIHGDALWVERTSAPDDGTCALARYEPSGRVTCEVKLAAMRDWRHAWSQSHSLLWHAGTKRLQRIARDPGAASGPQDIALPKGCAAPRVRLVQEPEPGAVVQCQKREMWSLVGDAWHQLPHPSRKDAWTLLQQRPASWPGQRLLSKRRATQGLLAASGEALWELPGGAQILAPTLLNARAEGTKRGLARWDRGPSAQLVAPASCEGRLWPTLATTPTRAALLCAPAQLGASCAQSSGASAVIVDHMAKQWRTDPRVLLAQTGPAQVWAHGMRVREDADACPARALEFVLTSSPDAPN